MLLNSKGQVTIPANLRAEHNLCEGDDVEVVSAEGASTKGQCLVRRLHGTALSRDVDGMTTDEIMHLLRGE
ncbi:AbrB/MazE/SpoVT family DNA-binding domain-containing protein [Nocardia sp. NPDC052278]|uniref:AbrB/MazE/SpoVT family DNA-binding domain-containing protein n=1 Tax=unclassified Nocardia TaxID=2637762 RepID=UPI0036AE0E99